MLSTCVVDIPLNSKTRKPPHSGHRSGGAFAFVSYDAFKQWEDGHQSEGGLTLRTYPSEDITQWLEELQRRIQRGQPEDEPVSAATVA